MDSPSLEHSDSDSGESWTLLEHNPALNEDASNRTDTPIKTEKVKQETHEKDDDTDGISIITDSENESSSPCQLHYETLYEEDQDLHLSQCFNLTVSDEQNKDVDDFLNIDHGKHKTYVHRRNKRLSTVLNIIVLGSVITAAGVAFGHMWGARTDCSMNTVPNVNNILSNLYKLQEENAYLRNKVKELTTNSHQSQIKGTKHNRCTKVFEESLNNDNTEKSIKCVDDKVDFSGILHNKNNKWSEPHHDFKENINTLKNIYKENKNWLDDEIVLRLQQEKQSRKRIKRSQNAEKLQKINEERDSKLISENKDTIVKGMDRLGLNLKSDSAKIVSYADSLKTLNKIQKEKFEIKNNSIPYYKNKRNKHEKVMDSKFERPLSDEDIAKDSRYLSPKFKQERKKNDRPKSYKKQKRRNKYEQWEMKGFMKDYDNIPVSRDSDINDPHKQDNIESININKKTSNNEQIHQDNTKLEDKERQKMKDYDNTPVSRDPDTLKPRKQDKIDRCIIINKSSNNEHVTQDCNTKKNNQESNISSPRPYNADVKGLFGDANWYFRRMHKREQCRAKTNNTYQKFGKRNMNYKMRH